MVGRPSRQLVAVASAMSRRSQQPSPALVIDGGLRFDMQPRHFVLGGGLLWLGLEATGCVLVVQAHADPATGEAAVSVSRIAALTGLSVRGAGMALARAVEQRALERIETGPGKKAKWRVIRWVMARTQAGEQVPICYPYVPNDEPIRRAALLAVAQSGDVGALPTGITVHIHIDQLQVVQAGGIGVQSHGGSSDEMSEINAWWYGLGPAGWNQALAAAGVRDGRITARTKALAWRAAQGVAL